MLNVRERYAIDISASTDSNIRLGTRSVGDVVFLSLRLRLTTQVFDPTLHSFGRLRFFDVSQRFVEEDVAGRRVVEQNHFSTVQISTPGAGLLQFDSPAKTQLDQNATAQT